MEPIKLPDPDEPNGVSFLSILRTRESRREFGERALTPAEVSFILWSTGGAIEGLPNRKVPPSAGACYPLDVYLSVREGGVDGVEPGLYKYLPGRNALEMRKAGDLTEAIVKAALGQEFIGRAPVTVVLTLEYERSTFRYGKRGVRYAHMDAGHAGQNVYLAAESLGLATVAVGAFNDDGLKQVLGLEEELHPICLFPVGAQA
jgi:SagB-type dehydrogenase family enzyme